MSDQLHQCALRRQKRSPSSVFKWGSSPTESTDHGEQRRLLSLARHSFRLIPFKSMSDTDLVGNDGTSLASRSVEANLGDCDAFVSHSWSDSAKAKWEVLADWASAFERMNQRTPLLWLGERTTPVNDLVYPCYLRAVIRVVAA